MRAIAAKSLLGCLLGLPVVALAQDYLPPVDRFYAGVGRYWSDNDLDTRWDATDGSQGTNVNFQRDLGFEDKQGALFWNIGGSLGAGHQHKIDAFGYDYDDESIRLLNRDLGIEDNTYPVDAAFAGELDVKVTGLSYTWFFNRSDQHAFGVGLGAVRYEVSADLAAAVVSEGSSITYENRLSEDAWAPMLRAEYAYSFAEHWRWGATLSYVKKSGGNVSGDAVDAQVEVEYFPWQHFGFSLRYNYNDVDLDFERRRFDGNVNLKNRGPQLLAMVRF